MKSDEITAFAPLLDTIDITGMTITADALHTQRKHVHYLRQHGAFYAMGNQPKLFDALNMLPWEERQPDHTYLTRGRSRIETRTIRVLPAPKNLRFPDARQAFLIEREVTDTTGRRLSLIAMLGIPSLTPDHATPDELAALMRGQWKPRPSTRSATSPTAKTPARPMLSDIVPIVARGTSACETAGITGACRKRPHAPRSTCSSPRSTPHTTTMCLPCSTRP